MSAVEGHLGQIRHIDVSPAWSHWAPLLPPSPQNSLHEHHITKLRTVEMRWHRHACSSVDMCWVSYLWLGLQISSYFSIVYFNFYFNFYLFFNRRFGGTVEREKVVFLPFLRVHGYQLN